MTGQGPDLDVSRAWLVDPASGREGPGDIVVEDGVLTSVTWLSGADADGVGPDGVVVAPGFIDLHAHLREPGNEEAETIASGLAAAAHGGFTHDLRHAEHDTHPGRARRARPDPCRRDGLWVAGRAAGLRRGHGRSGRGPAGRPR